MPATRTARWGIAIGGGLASALLFAVSAKGSPLAILLAYFAPLPVMIAAMGWGGAAGLFASLAGALTLGLALDLRLGVAFALGVGLPAWWLAHLVMLAKDDGGRLAWYPLGRAGAWAVALAVGMALFGMASVAWAAGGLSGAAEALARRLAPLVESMAGGAANLPQGLDALEFTRFAVRLLPAAMAGSALLMLVVNLWVAGRVVAVSGRLARPWPDVAAEFVLPKPMLAALAASAAAVALGGLMAVGGWVVAVAALCAYGLQGLGVVHLRSRGWGGRRALLIATYLALVLLMPWPFAFLAVVGVGDAALRLSRPPGP